MDSELDATFSHSALHGLGAAGLLLTGADNDSPPQKASLMAEPKKKYFGAPTDSGRQAASSFGVVSDSPPPNASLAAEAEG